MRFLLAILLSASVAYSADDDEPWIFGQMTPARFNNLIEIPADCVKTEDGYQGAGKVTIQYIRNSDGSIIRDDDYYDQYCIYKFTEARVGNDFPLTRATISLASQRDPSHCRVSVKTNPGTGDDRLIFEFGKYCNILDSGRKGSGPWEDGASILHSPPRPKAGFAEANIRKKGNWV